jgi:hypothetical protein
MDHILSFADFCDEWQDSRKLGEGELQDRGLEDYRSARKQEKHARDRDQSLPTSDTIFAQTEHSFE